MERQNAGASSEMRAKVLGGAHLARCPAEQDDRSERAFLATAHCRRDDQRNQVFRRSILAAGANVPGWSRRILPRFADEFVPRSPDRLASHMVRRCR